MLRIDHCLARTARPDNVEREDSGDLIVHVSTPLIRRILTNYREHYRTNGGRSDQLVRMKLAYQPVRREMAHAFAAPSFFPGPTRSNTYDR